MHLKVGTIPTIVIEIEMEKRYSSRESMKENFFEYYTGLLCWRDGIDEIRIYEQNKLTEFWKTETEAMGI